ncbi:MAG: WGR domain-containing protein [Anaerolineales bacterium]|nr:WGR domain-containing protein [Anaerolineales bacterium]
MLLIRIDPAKHIDRWYIVLVQPTLLDRWAVVCAWGNRRNNYQRWRYLLAESKEAAEELAVRVVQRKLRKGYQLLDCMNTRIP